MRPSCALLYWCVWLLVAPAACSRDSPEISPRRPTKRSAVVEIAEPAASPIGTSTVPAAAKAISAPTGSSVTMGMLDIDTTPQTDCVVDGNVMGPTPFTTTIAAGPHHVICVARADGGTVLKGSASPVVVAGGRAVVRLTL